MKVLAVGVIHLPSGYYMDLAELLLYYRDFSGQTVWPGVVTGVYTCEHRCNIKLSAYCVNLCTHPAEMYL